MSDTTRPDVAVDTEVDRDPDERDLAPRPPRLRRATEAVRGLPLAALVLLAAAIATVWRSTSGRYVGDNRFDQYWAPGWRILRETSLWDGTRGMGRVGEELWPLTLPLGFLRALGLDPVQTQQVWHVTVLTLAGLGVVVLVRGLAPRVGITHVVAALAYTYSPFGLMFLVPTNLHWSFVLTPWLLAVGLQGLRSPHPWRWAALWALLVATGGDTDLPGLVIAAAWIVPVAIYVVVVERTTTARRAAGWILGAGLLAAWVDLAVLVKVRLGAAPLAQRLLTTEGVTEVNLTSSWSESWRGLGYWVTYYVAPGRSGDVPGATAWFETVAGALATFIVPVVALIALGRLRWRLRLLWTGLAVLALTIMVGSNPTPNRSPAGGLLLWGYDTIGGLASFRTTYKAGPALVLGVAILAATGASAWGGRLARRDPRLRSVPLALLAVAVVATAVPVWSGELYAEDRQTDGIAAHWVEATDWLEDQPGDARVLVLPGSTQTAYRWGWVGDDILDSLLRQHPNVTPTNFPVSTPLTADLIDAIERRLEEERLTASELATVARRLGIGWVVVRNDLDWERIRAPRPQTLAPLRDDPALPLARTFGAVGEGTTAPDDDTVAAQDEARLHPIEVFEVPGVDGTRVPARSAAAPLLIDGGGDAWLELAGLGLLDGDRAVRFAGAATPDDVVASLESGSPLVLTDTNRRRLTLIRGPGPTSSEVLGADDDPGLVPPADLFGVPGTQTTATYTDAEGIEASDFGDDIGGFAPWFRPALAFDRDVRTSWRTGGQVDPTGTSLTLQLREPLLVERITLLPTRTEGAQRRLASVRVAAGGQVVEVDLARQGRTPVVLPQPALARTIRVTITGVEGDGDSPVGFSEVEIPGVDARERWVLPTHLTAGDDPAVTAATARAPLAYVLTRSGTFRIQGTTRHDEEPVLRRRLHLPAERELEVTGTLGGGRAMSDQAIDALLGGEVGAWGSTRPVLPSEGRGGLAIDGDPRTGWVGAAQATSRLTVRFPSQPVDRVRVRLGAGAGDVPLSSLLVSAGANDALPLPLAPDPACVAAPCDRIGEIALDPATADQLVLTVPETVAGSRRVRILEVEVSGPEGQVPLAGAPTGACGEGVVGIDGETVPMRVAAAAEDVLALLDEAAVPVEACAPVTLGQGAHDVDALADARVDQLVLATEGALTVPAEAAPGATVTDRGPASASVRLDGPGAGWVLSGQSHDPGWRARVGDEDLGPAVEVDGQSAWAVPAGEDRRVQLEFAPQGTFRAALVLSLVGALVCAGLVLAPSLRRRPRRGRDDEDGYGRPDAGSGIVEESAP